MTPARQLNQDRGGKIGQDRKSKDRHTVNAKRVDQAENAASVELERLFRDNIGVDAGKWDEGAEPVDE